MELLLLPSGKDLHSNCFIFLHPNRYSVNQKFICSCLPACLHSLFAVCFLPARACLKNALRKMCVTICGRFCSDEGVVVGYDNRIRTKYTAKWGVQIAGMILGARSRPMRLLISLPHPPAHPPACLPGWRGLRWTSFCQVLYCFLSVAKLQQMRFRWQRPVPAVHSQHLPALFALC